MGVQEQAIFTVSGQVYTADLLPSKDGHVIDGSTLLAGGSPIKINGADVSAITGRAIVGTDLHIESNVYTLQTNDATGRREWLV
jgi:hypothetical protein